MLSDESLPDGARNCRQLPDVRKAAYMANYGLTAYAAEQLVSSKYLADYFETAAQSTAAVKMLANLMISEVFRLLDGEDAKIPLNPASLAKIADMTEQSLISVGTAKKTIDALWDTPEDPEEYVTRMGLMQISDEAVLAEYGPAKPIDTHPEMVAGYRKGKLTLKNAADGRGDGAFRRQGEPGGAAKADGRGAGRIMAGRNYAIHVNRKGTRSIAAQGIADRIRELDESSATVALAAQALGCEPGASRKRSRFRARSSRFWLLRRGMAKSTTTASRSASA